MKHLSKNGWPALFVAVCIGCSPAPSTICAMPQNRHSWQGVEVVWRGEIIDVMSPPHGGGIYFSDYRCGASIELDPDTVPNIYAAAEVWSGHLAVADFEVSGRLSYKDGEVVLRPEKLKQTSPWLVDEGFDAYMEKRRAVLMEKGVLTITPE